MDLWNDSSKYKITSKIFLHFKTPGATESWKQPQPGQADRVQGCQQHHSRGSWGHQGNACDAPSCVPQSTLELYLHVFLPHHRHTFQISMCSSSTTWPAILPGACAHPYSSYYIMLADLPAGSCCKPDWGLNPAKNNSIGGVKVTSSTSRVDWKHTQTHSFRVWLQSNFSTSKFWLQQFHLARKSPCLGQQVKLWDLQSSPADTRGDCKSSNANQLC